MKSVNATDIQKRFGLWLEQSHREPVSICKHNREVAVLVDYEYFVVLEKLKKSLVDFKKKKGVKKASSSVLGMPSQMKNFLSEVESFGGLTDDDVEEFKKHSQEFREEFSL